MALPNVLSRIADTDSIEIRFIEIMRYVNSLPVTPGSANRDRVQGLNATAAVQPVSERMPETPHAAKRYEAVRPAEPPPPAREPQQDRRKLCRRILQQKVLVELRSGRDRRRGVRREGEAAQHIDEVV